MPSRRSFIAAGLAGGAALALAGWLRGPHAPASGTARRALDADAEAIMAAIAPVLLQGALPEGAGAAEAKAELLSSIDQAIAGLPPLAQAELAQFMALLALPPVRLALARISGGWDRAAPADVHAFLERLRTSSSMTLRSAYDALHQIVFAAWYGNPRSWAAIGYPGPPSLGAAAS